MKLLPITMPSYDWAGYIRAFQDAVGCSPIRNVDASGRKWTDAAKFLISLSFFHDEEQKDLVRTIRESGSLSKHLHFSFLVSGTKDLIFNITEKTDLAVTSMPSSGNDYVAVVSGTLAAWRIATLECCLEHQPYDLRLLFDGVVLYFEKFGLTAFWDDLKKKAIHDKTFILEHK